MKKQFKIKIPRAPPGLPLHQLLSDGHPGHLALHRPHLPPEQQAVVQLAQHRRHHHPHLRRLPPRLPPRLPLPQGRAGGKALRHPPPPALFRRQPDRRRGPQRDHLRRHVHQRQEQQVRQLLGVWRRHQAGAVRPADAALLEADLGAGGGEEAEEEPAEHQQPEQEEEGQGAVGQDHEDAASRAAAVPDHRVPAGDTGTAERGDRGDVREGVLHNVR